MTNPTHFHLKQSTGWFAAGREIEHALILLSDAAFKLFLWLCLHAERSRGSLSASARELASALQVLQWPASASGVELSNARSRVLQCKPSKHGHAPGRLRRRSSFIGHPDATFFHSHRKIRKDAAS